MFNMRDKIKLLIAKALGVEPQTMEEDSLLREDLGLESTDLTDLLLAVKEEYRTTAASKDIEDVKTVGELIDLIEINKEQ